MESSGQCESFEDKVRRLRQICEEEGLKLTHQRLEILRELDQASDHPSAETIHMRVQTRIPTISLDTTYRTLSTFEHYGLVSKVQVHEDRARFCGDASPHHHLYCKSCKEIGDFPWDDLEAVNLPAEIEKWGHISSKTLILEGTCNKCLKKRNK
jgi:Fur family peroxide stress response transcriptional regulator